MLDYLRNYRASDRQFLQIGDRSKAEYGFPYGFRVAIANDHKCNGEFNCGAFGACLAQNEVFVVGKMVLPVTAGKLRKSKFQ